MMTNRKRAAFQKLKFQVQFVENRLKKIWSDMICSNRHDFLKVFLPQILIDLFLNTLLHVFWQKILSTSETK